MKTRSTARRGAFTLVEIMIVVAIIGVVLAMGVPSFVRSMRQDALRKTVREIVEICSHARAQAIFRGVSAKLILHPLEGTLQVEVPPEAGEDPVEAPPPTPDSEPRRDQSAGIPTVTIPPSIHVEIVGVNFLDVTQLDEAEVRFHPNGTSDELTMILQSDQHEWRKITLDVVTGLAEVEILR